MIRDRDKPNQAYQTRQTYRTRKVLCESNQRLSKHPPMPLPTAGTTNSNTVLITATFRSSSRVPLRRIAKQGRNKKRAVREKRTTQTLPKQGFPFSPRAGQQLGSNAADEQRSRQQQLGQQNGSVERHQRGAPWAANPNPNPNPTRKGQGRIGYSGYSRKLSTLNGVSFRAAEERQQHSSRAEVLAPALPWADNPSDQIGN